LELTSRSTAAPGKRSAGLLTGSNLTVRFCLRRNGDLDVIRAGDVEL
jgi:hypothetical protein